MLSSRPLTAQNGKSYPTPLFLPVFERQNPFFTAQELAKDFGVQGVITNAFLLYRQRKLRQILTGPDTDLKHLLGFDDLVMTDSGAFQALSGPLYLKNSKIVRFQQEIGADIISPLDLITPPRDNWKTANRKLNQTLKRVAEALHLVDRALVAGVQQGGRFLDLRERAVRALVEMGVRYVALGSLVPFFGRNHHIRFAGQVIQQARQIVPPDVPIHLYGAGDPVELPFYVALGCDIFDSSSFIHFARDGWYMTPYGATSNLQQVAAYTCPCPYCQRYGQQVWQDTQQLVRHNLWVILHVVRRLGELRASRELEDYLAQVLERHMRAFPESQLAASWEALSHG
jgi:7-cyano-7-deazaguanine tRNA-ribosyltransferase